MSEFLEAALYRARAELLSKITLKVREMRKAGKTVDDIEEYLIANQVQLTAGRQKAPLRPMPPKGRPVPGAMPGVEVIPLAHAIEPPADQEIDGNSVLTAEEQE